MISTTQSKNTFYLNELFDNPPGKLPEAKLGQDVKLGSNLSVTGGVGYWKYLYNKC